ncbi:MAG: hypothetical protein JXR95_16315 [Deltaproteobacteria bacterium]|nr:hypothetical protein [Deltaproteobacteria bacterium]
MRRFILLSLALVLTVGCKGKDDSKTTPDGGNNVTTGGPRVDPNDPTAPVKGPGVARKPHTTAVSKGLSKKFAAIMSKYYKLAAKGWDSKDCEKVADEFSDLLKEKGGEKVATFAYNAGVTYFRCGKTDKAMDYMKKAVSMAGSYPAAQMTIAIIESNNNPEALLKYENDLMKDTESLSDPDINYNYAMIYYQMYKKSGRSVHMKKLLDYLRRSLANIGKINKDTLEAVRIRSQVYALTLLFYLEADRRKDANIDLANVFTQQAREFVGKTCSGKGAITDKWAMIALANYHNAAGLHAIYEKNIGRAFEEFKKAVECDPNDYSANLNIGMMGIRFRQPLLAIKSLELVISKYPSKSGTSEAELALGVAYKVYGMKLQDMADNQYENKDRLENSLKGIKEVHKAYKKGLELCEKALGGGDVRKLLTKLQPYIEEVKRRAWNAAAIRKGLDKGEITVKQIKADVKFAKNILDDAVNNKIPKRIQNMEAELTKLADVNKLKSDAKTNFEKSKSTYERYIGKHSGDYRPVFNLAVLMYKAGDLMGDSEGNMKKALDMFSKVSSMKGVDKNTAAMAKKYSADIKSTLIRLKEAKNAPKTAPKAAPKKGKK